MKLRKFLFLILMSPLLFAEGIFMGESLYPQQQSVDDGQVKTMADYAELVSSLESSMKMGLVGTSSYYLGTVYLTDFNLTDGDIQKDINKAKHYFKISLENGNYMAAYNLAMIDIYNKDYDSALFLIDNTLSRMPKSGEKAEATKKFLSALFASIVLEFKPSDTEAVRKAIDTLEPYAGLDVPTSMFLLANLYRIDGNIDKANLLLNTACTRGQGSEIKQLCRQFKVQQKEGRACD